MFNISLVSQLMNFLEMMQIHSLICWLKVNSLSYTVIAPKDSKNEESE